MELVNRGERIRARAWKRIQAGDLKGYQRLVALGLEAHSIREAATASPLLSSRS